MDAESTLAVKYATSYPTQAARRLETVSSGDLAAFLAHLKPETAAALVESMLPSTVAAAFETMDRDSLSMILEHLPIARCVLVMRSVDKDRKATIMSLLPKNTALKVERLVRSSIGSAGVLAEPVTAVLSPDMSVEEAQHVGEGTGGPYVYVVDAEHRLLGVMHRKELARSDHRARVGNLMSRQVVKLPSAAPNSAIRSHHAWNDYDILPVVDGTGVLVGVIRHKDIRRTGHAPQTTPTERRAALTTILDLGELYWGGLTSMFTAIAGKHTPGGSAEVKNDA